MKKRLTTCSIFILCAQGDMKMDFKLQKPGLKDSINMLRNEWETAASYARANAADKFNDFRQSAQPVLDIVKDLAQRAKDEKVLGKDIALKCNLSQPQRGHITIFFDKNEETLQGTTFVLHKNFDKELELVPINEGNCPDFKNKYYCLNDQSDLITFKEDLDNWFIKMIASDFGSYDQTPVFSETFNLTDPS